MIKIEYHTNTITYDVLCVNINIKVRGIFLGNKVLSQQIAELIKEMIINGELKLGEQIPNEQDLILKFNISRSTIREAVKILASQNILEIRRGNGTFVSSTPGIVDDPLGFDFLPRIKLINDLIELRALLEPRAALLASRRATPTQMAKLKSLSDDFDEIFKAVNLDDINPEALMDRMAQIDMEFHNLIYKMTQNQAMERLIPIVNKVLAKYYTSKGFRTYFRYKKGTHRYIYEAIRDANEPEILRLCSSHMDKANDLIRK